ncbi:MAG: ester cyclase [Bryobacteraceae bacterium]
MTDPTSVVRTFVDEFQTKGDESVAERLLAPDFVDHTPFPGFGSTRGDVIQLFRVLRGAFPDLRAEVTEQFDNGTTVATRKTFHGTHRSEFMGIPPTGNPVAIRVVDFVRVEDGLMKEHWNVVDVPGLMAQLSE